MRAWNRLLLYVFLAAPIPLASCAKEIEAEFPRPPATASTPPVEEETPSPAEPESSSEEPVVAEDVPPEEPLTEVPTPPSAKEPPSQRPDPVAPTTPPAAESAEERPSTQLSGSNPVVDPEVLAKMRRAGSLLGSVEGRTLSSEQREQVTAAKAFVAQAREASVDGDERRALVLIDKALILAEDVERSSRR